MDKRNINFTKYTYITNRNMKTLASRLQIKVQ